MVDLFTYSMIVLLLVLAPFIGLLISYFSREELKKGKGLFIFALRIAFLLGVTIFSLSTLAEKYLMAYALLWIASLATMIWSRGEIIFTKKSGYSYLVYSFLVGSSKVAGNIFQMAALLFVAGLLNGSVQAAINLGEKKGFSKAVWKLSYDTLWFAVVALGWGLFLSML